MGLLDIGVTGLLANQTALSTVGNNISNANVEGYTRQDVVFGSNPSEFRGGGFIGQGVQVQTIRRITDEFITQQLRLDTASFNQLDVLNDQLQQLDSLVADEATGLSSSLNSFFSAIQSAVDSPTSLPVRDLVLSEAERLAQRFNSIDDRLREQAASINDQVASYAPLVTELAQNIASINQKIIESSSVSQIDQDNNLLDQRDILLRQLSELVSYTTSTPGDGTVNVFVGGGQPLVLGGVYNEIVATPNNFDPSKTELAININGNLQPISSSFSGGQIGGLLSFRDGLLSDISAEMNLFALAVADSFNSQHQAGLDANGDYGVNFFNAINTELAQSTRVSHPSTNALPDDRQLSVFIDDVSSLEPSDYTLSFSGTSNLSYALTRLSDGQVVSQGTISNIFPQTTDSIDGFTINLESGSFQSGDTFLISPTRNAANDFLVNVKDPTAVALSSPVIAGAGVSNLGTGTVISSSVIGTDNIDLSSLPAFANSGSLTPPLLIRFTSATTYDVLDNSGPANPVQMSPPLRSLPYLPSQTNGLLFDEPGMQSISSTGSDVFTAIRGPLGAFGNGYPGETISVSGIDENNGQVINQSVTLLANESAATVAARVNTLSGVTAVANTEASFRINDDGDASLLRLTLNGVDLTNPADGAVPNPVTSDFIAQRINTLFAGTDISASSNSGELTIRSTSGQDLRLHDAGSDTGDTVDALSVNGVATVNSINGFEFVIGGTVDLYYSDSVTVSSTGGIFTDPTPIPTNVYLGYQVEINGAPQAGDLFTVDFNQNGVADNRNALALVNLQSADILAGGTSSVLDMYGQLVARIGSETSGVSIDLQAAESLLTQTKSRLDSVAGVNLDEEAALLLQFEQAYNAAAQIITVAREIFDTLLASFR